jgi:hypothetical protein
LDEDHIFYTGTNYFIKELGITHQIPKIVITRLPIFKFFPNFTHTIVDQFQITLTAHKIARLSDYFYTLSLVVIFLLKIDAKVAQTHVIYQLFE